MRFCGSALGTMLDASGKMARAIPCYLRALRTKPPASSSIRNVLVFVQFVSQNRPAAHGSSVAKESRKLFSQHGFTATVTTIAEDWRNVRGEFGFDATAQTTLFD